MKNVSKIFVWAFIILSFLPFFEFFVFQWKNENRISLDTKTKITVLNYSSGSNAGYVVYSLPENTSSFTDYIIKEYSYGIIDDNANTVNLQGFAKPIFMTMANITRRMASSTASGPFIINLISLSLLITRSVYIACLLLLAYIIILPVVVISDFFKRRLKL